MTFLKCRSIAVCLIESGGFQVRNLCDSNDLKLISSAFFSALAGPVR
ncbi:hypothetical protein Z946_3238 [Sulfitobacter noctilucicola]|nr:hypothetical protein Z946_3238 [Sulfitobacter noctilucicola]